MMHRFNLKIRTKLVILFLVTALVPLLVINLLIFVHASQTLETSVKQKLDALVTVQKNRVEGLVKDNKELMELILHKQMLIQDIDMYETKKAASTLTEITSTLIIQRNAIARFEKISVTNITGSVIASTDTADIGKDMSQAAYFQQGVAKEDVAEFGKDADGHVINYLAGPILYQGKTLGVIVISSDTKALYAIFHDYTGLGNTGDWGLTKRLFNGDGLVIVPSRFDTNPETPLGKTLSGNQTNLPAIQAINGNETVENLTDFRGVAVIAATRYLSDVGWGIVVKVDQDEAFGLINTLRNQLFYLGALLVIFILFAGSFLTQIISAPIFRLIEMTRRIRDGDLQTPNSVHGTDEIGQLGESLSEMMVKLRGSYAALQTQAARESVMLDNMGEGLLGLDDALNITFVNKAMEQLIGTHEFEALGKIVTDSIILQDAEECIVPVVLQPCTIALKEHMRVERNDLFCVSKDGSIIPVSVIAAPIIAQGEGIGVIVTMHDRTKEEVLERAKDEFLSIAAHQLRTPLGSTRWNLERLLAGRFGDVTDAMKSTFVDMAKSNIRLINLVNALLDVSRINQSKVEDHPQKVNIVDIITATIHENAPLAERFGITVNLTGESIVDMMLDPRLFTQVIENVLTNAIKYNKPGGSVTIDVSKHKSMITLTISDTGIGIPADDLAHIFEKFHRAANVTKGDTEGTGLGLFIVKSYLDRWHGKIWYTSTEGEGTTCFIRLPLPKD